jgi:DNA-binding NtrC family response regulator
MQWDLVLIMAASILVVEDDPLGRNLICEVLRSDGHQPFEASDGAEALELLQTQPFNLVISDFVMPKLDGLKLLGHLHSVSPRMPVILISGYMSEDSGKKILQQTAEFLPKPFDLDVLRSTVQRLLM